MSGKNRPHWSSNLGFFLAAAGSAVGLGNIYKFPYIVGMNGGGAFVLVYLLCISLVGVPVLLCELFIGQQGQSNTVESYAKVDPTGSKWRIAGLLGLISAFIILSFYCVVGGWILDFSFLAFSNSFTGHSETAIKAFLPGLFASAWRQTLLLLAFLTLTVSIVYGGLIKGIERWNKILMPGMVLLLLVLLVYSSFLPGFLPACKFLFLPDLSHLQAHSVLEAIGHSFFTLSVAVGVMVTYGSYLSKQENLPKMAYSIAVIDTLLALGAGIVVFSAVFTYGLQANAGPTLIFQTLPVLFSKMPGGAFAAVLFFLLVTFTALTSAMSLLEVVVAYACETWDLSRKPTTLLVGLATFVLGIPSALSFNALSELHILGLSFFDFCDKLTSTLFLPLSGLLTSLFVGWKLGPKAVRKLVAGSKFAGLEASLLFCLRFLTPVGIAIILVLGLDWLY